MDIWTSWAFGHHGHLDIMDIWTSWTFGHNKNTFENSFYLTYETLLDAGILGHFLLVFTCGALAQHRSSSCPVHLLPKFQNEFVMAQKAKFNMESYAIWVQNFKSEDIFGLRGHSEAIMADFKFTSKNLDCFLIFRQRVSIAKKHQNNKPKGQKIPKDHPSNSRRRSIRSGPCWFLHGAICLFGTEICATYPVGEQVYTWHPDVFGIFWPPCPLVRLLWQQRNINRK